MTAEQAAYHRWFVHPSTPARLDRARAEFAAIDRAEAEREAERRARNEEIVTRAVTDWLRDGQER